MIDDGIEYARFERIRMEGADASGFAQAQLAADVAAMADGTAQWSSYLTPQGRVVALFVVHRRGVDAIDLYVPAARGVELADRLRRFVFRAKVKLTVDDAPVAPSSVPGLESVANDEPGFRRWAIEHRLPLIAGAAIESHVPHALELDALGAVSTKKGCYPGQEIVARTHFLGRNKRRLVRFGTTAPAAPIRPGDALKSAASSTIEAVLSVNDSSGRVGGLAVAHEQALEEVPWHAPDGTPVVHGP